MSKIAIYPGSFDPVTKGHVDIVARALSLFDKVIVAVSDNPQKKHTFTAAERVGILKETFSGTPNVEVDSFSGLLVDFLRAKKARILIRGLRAVSDLEYEFQIASMNHYLYPEAETVFLMPDAKYTYLSSSMVKEVAGLGGNMRELVPPCVERMLSGKFHSR